MLTDYERYLNIIIDALEVQNLRMLIEERINNISMNIIVDEASKISFDNGSCIMAFNYLSERKDILISPN